VRLRKQIVKRVSQAAPSHERSPQPHQRPNAWAAGDFLTAALHRKMGALPEPENQLTAGDKAKRTAELTARLDKLEREETVLVERGQHLHRADCSALAVLSVGIVAPKAQA
jgi:hypothetical protein